MQISVKFPDGHVQDLIKIDDWDFNWQYTYHFEKPSISPRARWFTWSRTTTTRRRTRRNPNHPPKLVKWGEATTDEMCIGFIGVTKKGQDLTQARRKRRLQGHLAEARGRTSSQV